MTEDDLHHRLWALRLEDPLSDEDVRSEDCGSDAGESSVTCFGSMLLDPKYADLTVQCQGREYRVHRVLLCSASKVFDAELDSAFEVVDAGFIEHTTFDPLTLERMLQFIYTRDYTVTAVLPSDGDRSLKLVTQAGESEETTATNPTAETLPNRSRRLCTTDKTCGLRASTRSPATTATTPAIAHVLVYAIADCYQIPKLKDLALKKLSRIMTAIQIDEYPGFIGAVYAHTHHPEDPLRQDTLKMALSSSYQVVANSKVLRELVKHEGLQLFAVDFLPAIVDQVKSSTGVVSRLEGDLQAAQLLLVSRESQLEAQADELSRHAQCIDTTKKDVEARATTILELRARITELTTQNANLAQARENADYLTCELGTKLARKAEALTKLDGNYRQLCQDKSAVATERNRALTEKQQALQQKESVFADLLKTQEKLQKVQGELRDANTRINTYRLARDRIVQLQDETTHCRQCGDEMIGLVQIDNRSTSSDQGFMLRCEWCRTRHFAR